MKTIITNKTIWNIAYPIILGSLAQTLITLTDTAFLGRVSEIALGASAMAGIYYYVFSTLAWGFSIGIQIIVARRLGEGKLNRIGVVFEHGLCFVFLLSTTLFLVQRYYSDILLGASIQSPNIYAAAMEYMSYRHYGIIFVCFNFLFRALYIGLSNTKIWLSRTGSRWRSTSLRDGRDFRLPYFHFLYLIKTPGQTICPFLVPQVRRMVNAHRSENGLPYHVTKTIVIRDMVYIFHAHRTHGRTPHRDNHYRTQRLHAHTYRRTTPTGNHGNPAPDHETFHVERSPRATYMLRVSTPRVIHIFQQ